MKSIFILLALCTYFNLTAQVWVENNAVWHYDFWNLGEGGFYKVQHVNDTLISGKSCKQIDIMSDRFWIYTGNPYANDTIIHQGSSLFGTQYTYQSNDSVYRWDNGTFRLLFDFNAQVGDQWVISTQPSPFTSTCTDTSIVEVIAAGIQNINGMNYRYITLQSPLGSSWRLNGTFNERFGGDFIFPREGDNPCGQMIFEMDILTFKCFEDDSMSLYNPSGEDCEFYLTHLGTGQLESKRILLFPNPTYGELNINNSKVSRIEIYSSDGRFIASRNFHEPVEKFSLPASEPGLYYLHLYNKNGEWTMHRVVKK